MEQYWSRVEALHRDHHVASELAIEIDTKANFSQLVELARSLTGDVVQLRDILLESDDALAEDLVSLVNELGIPGSALENHRDQTRSFHARNWEVLNLGLSNTVTKLHVALSQMEIKYLEEFIKLNPHDSVARLRLEKLKVEFETIATSAGYVD